MNAEDRKRGSPRHPARLEQLVVLAAVAFVALVANALAEDAKPKDHASYIKGPFATGPEVTAACLECHAKQANDLMKTAHWKWKGPARSLKGFDPKNPAELGKLTLINNFCISIEGGPGPTNRQKCSICHTGYGFVDKDFDFSNAKQIDCLVCHAREGMYKKSFGGFPDERMLKNGRMDLAKAAKSVGKPTRRNCLTCHAFGGAGECVKHGDMSSSLEEPEDAMDVHMGKTLNLDCQSCHTTKDHRVSGQSMFTATYEERVSCRDCHDDPHASVPEREALDKHLGAVACETCHVPAHGRDVATQLSWDWSTAGRTVPTTEQFDRECYAKEHGEMTWGKNVVPVYAWFNGTIDRYLKGQKIEGNGPLALNRPVGDIADPSARITPFKVHNGRQPMDSQFRHLLTPHTFKGYWEHYDWDRALKDGAAGSGLAYSGKYEFIATVEYSGLHHMVPPKANALRCAECHDGGKRLDWLALGYSGDPKKVGARKLPPGKEGKPPSSVAR